MEIGKYNNQPTNDSVTYDDSTLVRVNADDGKGDEFIHLCGMCKHSPLTCENEGARRMIFRVPSGHPKEEYGDVIVEDGSIVKMGLGSFEVDGVETGEMKIETDCNPVYVCEYFAPKPRG